MNSFQHFGNILTYSESPALKFIFKDVHIVVLFAYLLSSYRKFEWAENAAVQACSKKLSGKQISSKTFTVFYFL